MQRQTKVPGKRGRHIVAWCFLGCANWETFVADTKCFWTKSETIFCVPDTKFVSATNVARVGKRGNICVGNNVSSFARVLTCSTCFQLFNKLLLSSKIIVFLSKDKKLKFMGLKMDSPLPCKSRIPDYLLVPRNGLDVFLFCWNK